MIESAAYDIIKKDGIQEGLEKGKKETILEFLEARFGTVPNDLVEGIQKIENRTRLKSLVRLAASCDNMETFRKKYMMNG